MPNKNTLPDPFEGFIEDTDAEQLTGEKVAPQPIIGDRGEPVTKAPRQRFGKKVVATVALLAGLVLMVGGLLWFIIGLQKAETARSEDVPVDKSTAPAINEGRGLGALQEEIEQEQNRQAALRKAEEERRANRDKSTSTAAGPDLGKFNGGQQANTANGGTANTGGGTADQEKTPAQKAAERRVNDDVVWTGTGVNTQRSMAEGSSNDPSATQPDSTISDSMRSERLANGSVGKPFNLKYQLKRGEYIPCTLLPQIITNYAGFVDCTVNKDVYSADGSVLLVNRGAVAHGERKVAMTRGVSSVFASFGEIVNTDGTPIDIGSLATNALGATGIDAEIDNHNAERFGGAILLAALDDTFGALSKRASGSGSAEFDNSTNTGSDIASKALDSTVNIAPTGYVQHGQQIYIYVSRNIDFSSHYGVK